MGDSVRPKVLVELPEVLPSLIGADPGGDAVPANHLTVEPLCYFVGVQRRHRAYFHPLGEGVHRKDDVGSAVRRRGREVHCGVQAPYPEGCCCLLRRMEVRWGAETGSFLLACKAGLDHSMAVCLHTSPEVLLLHRLIQAVSPRASQFSKGAFQKDRPVYHIRD